MNRRPCLLIVSALVLLLSLHAHAQEPRAARPESVGVSAARLAQIDAFVAREIEAGHLSGAVTLVAREGKIVHFASAGRYGTEDARELDADAIFRIFSMTKPITTVAAMILYEEGHFQLGDPVAKYLPQFAEQKVMVDGELRAPATPITIAHLMTHTAGLGYGLQNADSLEALYQSASLQGSRDSDDFIERVAALPLRFEPGTRYFYSVGSDVLGVLVEKWSGETLEAFMQRRIFTPLGMRDTFFNVPDDKLARVAGNHYWDAEAGRLAPVAAADVWPQTRQTLFSGGAGLFSTARDYLVFCEMLRRGGSYEGARILGPKTVEFMTIDQLGPAVRDNGAAEFPAYHLYPGQSFGLGFAVITEPGQAGVISSAGEYSWGGAANTKFWIDPQEDLVGILMSQVLGSPWSDHTRFGMKVATYQALTRLNRR